MNSPRGDPDKTYQDIRTHSPIKVAGNILKPVHQDDESNLADQMNSSVALPEDPEQNLTREPVSNQSFTKSEHIVTSNSISARGP